LVVATVVVRVLVLVVVVVVVVVFLGWIRTEMVLGSWVVGGKRVGPKMTTAPPSLLQ
jgi:hypothetical protein